MTADRYVSLFRTGERHTFEYIEQHPSQDGNELEHIKLADNDEGYTGNLNIAVKIGGPVLLPTRSGDWLLVMEPEEAEQFQELWPEIRDKWNASEPSQGRAEEAQPEAA